MTFKARDVAFDLKEALVMGILNVTPDSFSDGGEAVSLNNAINKAKTMLDEGADIIDIGGQSTRPGFVPVSPKEELDRVLPVVKEVLKLGAVVSVDTFYSEVAKEVLQAGSHIINDVSGKTNPDMLKVVKDFGAGYIVMHNDSTFINVKDKLKSLAEDAESFGVEKENICIDVGFGFHKDTLDENLSLLLDIPNITELGYPLLVGLSRKRFVGELSGKDNPKDRDGMSAFLSSVAVKLGADIIRVHNVKMNK